LGPIFVDGHGVGLEHIRSGMAWWYRTYSKEPESEALKMYANADLAAKEGWDGTPFPLHPGRGGDKSSNKNLEIINRAMATNVN